MPFIILEEARSPKNLFYRDYGEGTPLLFLHGGWGYTMYPFDAQIDVLSRSFRILIPDRTGYGKSPRLESFPRGFHETAAEEMRRFLDGMGIQQCVLWGHSDGAVTALRMALTQPDRFPAIIAEAVHDDRCKASSLGFFETAAVNPRKFGASVAAAMAKEHGEDYWETLMSVHGKAWLDILATCHDPALDLYSGRLGDLRGPALLIHGSQDPRTEPGELEHLQSKCPVLQTHIVPGGGHSPHSEPEYAAEVTLVAERFLRSLGLNCKLISD